MTGRITTTIGTFFEDGLIQNRLGNSEAQELFANDINGLYNNFWPQNGRILTVEEMNEATNAMARIIKKIRPKNNECLNLYNNYYFASATVCLLIVGNSKNSFETPLLYRLDKLERLVIRLGRKIWKTFKYCECKNGKCVQKMISDTARISATLLAFSKSFDPNQVDVDVNTTQEVFDLIQNTENSGLFNF